MMPNNHAVVPYFIHSSILLEKYNHFLLFAAVTSFEAASNSELMQPEPVLLGDYRVRLLELPATFSSADPV